MRKLAGLTDLEDALKKLDRLTQEEVRMALAEILRVTHDVSNEVKVVDGKVDIIGDNVQGVDDKVQAVIDGARGLSGRLLNSSDIYTFRWQRSKSSGEEHR
jgi:hypothetical protein